MTDFVSCSPGTPIGSGYVRVTLEESLAASLMHGLETRTGDSSYLAASVKAFVDPLRDGSNSSLDFVTPVSSVEVTPGDRVAVLDFRVFPRAGITFAELARRMNEARGLTVHTVEWLGATPGNAAARAQAVEKQNEQIKSESPLDTLGRYLKNAGIAVLVIIVIIVAVLLWKWSRSLTG